MQQGFPYKHKMIVRLVLALNILLCTSALAVPVAMPRSGQVALFVAPWSDPSEIMSVISASNGAFVGAGQRDWIGLASSTDDGFTSRLYANGAWLVVDAAFAAACLPKEFRNAYN